MNKFVIEQTVPRHLSSLSLAHDIYFPTVDQHRNHNMPLLLNWYAELFLSHCIQVFRYEAQNNRITESPKRRTKIAVPS